MNQTQQLLRQTATRLWLAALGRHWHHALLTLCALALVGLLVARLLGLVTIGFVPLVLGAFPLATLLVALLIARRPSARETARAIDTRAGGKELFLTAALIGGTPGGFQPIVVAQAEERAGTIPPALVAPWPWPRGFLHAILALTLLATALRWLPQLDPFGHVAKEQKVAKQEGQLQESRKVTAQRAEVLAEQGQQQAARVQQALAALDKTFRQAKPQEREANLRELGEQQKEIGELWRKVNNPELKSALEKGAQSFGRLDPQKLAEWLDQLKKGDLSGLKQELSAMREQMKQLGAQPDSAEKRVQQEKLAQKLSQIAEAMKQSLGSPQASEAVARALAQMDAAKQGQLSKAAMESAAESLQLSQQELEQLAQSLKDSEALEEALKSLQMAKQLAGTGQLDGEGSKNALTMQDYADLFAQKMAELAEGQGQGQPGGDGPGIGDGSKRPEADTAITSFKPEKSPTALTTGKMLIEWKTREVGETGARAEEFRDAVREVKQGVSEALQAEQVPPGYHDTIKKYFDTLPEKKGRLPARAARARPTLPSSCPAAPSLPSSPRSASCLSSSSSSAMKPPAHSSSIARTIPSTPTESSRTLKSAPASPSPSAMTPRPRNPSGSPS